METFVLSINFQENARMLSTDALRISARTAWGILYGDIFSGYSYALWKKTTNEALEEYAVSIEKELLRRGHGTAVPKNILDQARAYTLPDLWKNGCLINSHRMMHMRLYPFESVGIVFETEASYDGAFYYHRTRGLFNPYNGDYTKLDPYMVNPKYCCFHLVHRKPDFSGDDHSKCNRLVTQTDGNAICSIHMAELKVPSTCKYTRANYACSEKVPQGIKYCPFHEDFVFGDTDDEMTEVSGVTVVENDEEVIVTIKKKKKNMFRSFLKSCLNISA